MGKRVNVLKCYPLKLVHTHKASIAKNGIFSDVVYEMCIQYYYTKSTRHSLYSSDKSY